MDFDLGTLGPALAAPQQPVAVPTTVFAGTIPGWKTAMAMSPEDPSYAAAAAPLLGIDPRTPVRRPWTVDGFYS